MTGAGAAFTSPLCLSTSFFQNQKTINPPRTHRPFAPRNPRPVRRRQAQATLEPTLETKTSTNSVKFISLANNTFVLECGDIRLLIDPFLEEELVFFSPAFFRSAKPPELRSLSAAGAFDAVVLTQHLPDHAHEPTLRKIGRSTPVFAPRQALPLLSRLGFHNVQRLQYDRTILPLPSFPHVKLTAGRGSVVGPPGSPPQLALVFSFGDLSVYHEPHGSHDAEFLARWRGKIDAAIAPVVDTKIPALGNYALVNGVREAVELCKQLRPRRFVGFDNSGGEQSGWLVQFLKQRGGIDEFRRLVEGEEELKKMNVVFTEKSLEPVVIASVPDAVSAE